VRLLVVQPPPAPGLDAAPLGVGAVHWHAPEHAVSLVVKAAFSFEDGRTLALRGEHPRPTREVESTLAGLRGELAYPSDFVPFKPQVDVLLTGHAYADGAPSARIDARVALGSVGRSFTVVASLPTDRIPLGAAYLRDVDGIGPAEPVGPVRLGSELEPDFVHPDDFDFAVYCFAVPAQRSAPPREDATLELTGLSPKGRLRLALPDVAPRAIVQWTDATGTELSMNLDTLWIDTDGTRAIATWRGVFEHPVEARIDKVFVALERTSEERSWDAIVRGAARGRFGYAVEPDAPSPEPRPGTDEAERLEIARFEAHGVAQAPEPSMALEEYAFVSAELAEQREPRAETLRRHGLDESAWLLEERGWLEAMAHRATDGDGTLAARYGELFVAAQDRLGAPVEAERTLADYAAILVALEDADDLPKALEDRRLTLAAWMRLDRRVQRGTADDPALAAELERRVASERAARAARATGAPR
jgi:hypothetical protein